MKGAKRATLLVVLGLANMAGSVFDSPKLSGLALATAASPAPKVFTSARGLETFSSRYQIVWEEDGERRTDWITYRDYVGIEGPYNRRNLYGAVLAYGPVLAATPTTRPMFDSVTEYALCGDAPLLRELGLDPTRMEKVRVVVHPRPGTDIDLPTTLEAPCR